MSFDLDETDWAELTEENVQLIAELARLRAELATAVREREEAIWKTAAAYGAVCDALARARAVVDAARACVWNNATDAHRDLNDALAAFDAAEKRGTT